MVSPDIGFLSATYRRMACHGNAVWYGNRQCTEVCAFSKNRRLQTRRTSVAALQTPVGFDEMQVTQRPPDKITSFPRLGLYPRNRKRRVSGHRQCHYMYLRLVGSARKGSTSKDTLALDRFPRFVYTSPLPRSPSRGAILVGVAL